jgi:hypothetical protein
MVMENLRLGNMDKLLYGNDTETKQTYKAIEAVVTFLLKDERMNLFIVRNRGEMFTIYQPKTETDGSLDYNVSKTWLKINRDLYAEYRKTHRTSRSRSIPQRAPFRMLFPFVFMEKNWNVPHYFILYYEDGRWYIYSSYLSDFVRIGVAKIEIDIHQFVQFMRYMYTFPRSPHQVAIIEDFFRRCFLANPTQQIGCVENPNGKTISFKPKKEKGVSTEIDFYRARSIMTVYIPEFTEYLEELMKEDAEAIQAILVPAGLSLKPSFLPSISSAGSMTGVSVTPGHTTHTSGP